MMKSTLNACVPSAILIWSPLFLLVSFELEFRDLGKGVGLIMSLNCHPEIQSDIKTLNCNYNFKYFELEVIYFKIWDANSECYEKILKYIIIQY